MAGFSQGWLLPASIILGFCAVFYALLETGAGEGEPAKRIQVMLTVAIPTGSIFWICLHSTLGWGISNGGSYRVGIYTGVLCAAVAWGVAWALCRWVVPGVLGEPTWADDDTASRVARAVGIIYLIVGEISWLMLGFTA